MTITRSHKRNTQRARDAASALRVFSTPELLEMVLVWLACATFLVEDHHPRQAAGMRDLLRLQQTCTAFRDTIRGSITLKRLLWLAPETSETLKSVRYGPLGPLTAITLQKINPFFSANTGYIRLGPFPSGIVLDGGGISATCTLSSLQTHQVQGWRRQLIASSLDHRYGLFVSVDRELPESGEISPVEKADAPIAYMLECTSATTLGSVIERLKDNLKADHPALCNGF